jgi:hypothetical protein
MVREQTFISSGKCVYLCRLFPSTTRLETMTLHSRAESSEFVRGKLWAVVKSRMTRGHGQGMVRTLCRTVIFLGAEKIPLRRRK